jgi:NAD(P)-dependent dehydrogenase (short-subunit alcohol dehydrogenase family)
MSAATINYLQSSGEWNFLLSNKMVFISGGGGYISQSIACTCYLHGAKFVLADINKQGALDVKQQILKQDNKFDVNSDDDDDRMLVIEVDVADENSVKQAVGLAMSKWNKINILINT